MGAWNKDWETITVLVSYDIAPPWICFSILQVVADYNADPKVHGILVQLPLPKHIDEKRILDTISIEKDVDGFHPINIGMLAMRGRTPKYVSCTPKVPPLTCSKPNLLPPGLTVLAPGNL